MHLWHYRVLRRGQISLRDMTGNLELATLRPADFLKKNIIFLFSIISTRGRVSSNATTFSSIIPLTMLGARASGIDQVNSLHHLLQWRHNERDGVLNHGRHDYLVKRLFRDRSKETSKLRVTGLWDENPPLTGEFPSLSASYAEMFPFRDAIMFRCTENHHMI